MHQRQTKNQSSAERDRREINPVALKISRQKENGFCVHAVVKEIDCLRSRSVFYIPARVLECGETPQEARSKVKCPEIAEPSGKKRALWRLATSIAADRSPCLGRLCGGAAEELPGWATCDTTFAG